MRIFTFITALLLSLSALQANAGLIYDEATDGDAAGDSGGFVIGADLGLLSAGSSTVKGTTPGGSEDDWFKFSIGNGFTLDSIILSAFSGPGGNLGWSEDGSSISADHTGPLNSSMVGSDLLESAALYSVSSSYGMGSYAIKLGTGTNHNSYTLDFNVSGSDIDVPEPSSLALLALGLTCVGFSRKKAK